MKFPKNAPMNNKTGFRREFRAGFCRAFVLVANEISSERQVGGSNVGGVPSSRAHNQHLKRLYLAKTICASSDVQATRLCHQPNPVGSLRFRYPLFVIRSVESLCANQKSLI